jgi:phosphonatase-like hydrolase
MNIRLVVLNMVGTAVHDGDAENACLRQVLANEGFRLTRDEVNAVIGLPHQYAIRKLIEKKRKKRSEIAESLINALYDDFRSRMLQFYGTDPGVRPMPHAVESLRQIRAAGIKIALDTGFSRAVADVILDHLGWDDGSLLDATVAGDEVPRGKPFPDLIERAMNLTGISRPSEVAKVGDTPTDLQHGAVTGCGLVIGVTNGSHTRLELLPYPYRHMIASLQELPALVLTDESDSDPAMNR